MHKMNAIDWLAMILLIIGGLNWGLVGLADIDLVQMLFGSIPMLANTIYVLVGISALYSLFRTATKH